MKLRELIITRTFERCYHIRLWKIDIVYFRGDDGVLVVYLRIAPLGAGAVEYNKVQCLTYIFHLFCKGNAHPHDTVEQAVFFKSNYIMNEARLSTERIAVMSSKAKKRYSLHGDICDDFC